MLVDASHQELVIIAAFAGERDKNEKVVKFWIFCSGLPNSIDASKPDPVICRAYSAL
jgi:hypothetical protein